MRYIDQFVRKDFEEGVWLSSPNFQTLGKPVKTSSPCRYRSAEFLLINNLFWLHAGRDRLRRI